MSSTFHRGARKLLFVHFSFTGGVSAETDADVAVHSIVVCVCVCVCVCVSSLSLFYSIQSVLLSLCVHSVHLGR